MRRPVGGDTRIEKYLLAVDNSIESQAIQKGEQFPKPVAAWTGGAWTWTWLLSREPVADLVVSVRPYFFPAGGDEAEFKELRVELGGRVWNAEQPQQVSTALYYAHRFAREDIEQAKDEELVRGLFEAVNDALVDLRERARVFNEQPHRVNWVERFNQEIRSP